MPRSLPAAIPQKTRGKSKGNRSVRCIPGGNEAIWDEELHTALIEALNIYPPMGRQRRRPIHDGGEGQPSLGRCQLIQQYLIHRTGKNRTRKQISSRIQRLRRMHQDDPEMADVLRILPAQQPVAPEMLVNLDDSSEGMTVVLSLVPATPPLLGSEESSASSSPSTNPLGDSCHSSASRSSVHSSQLSPRPLETADLSVSNSGDAVISISAPGSEQENMWPEPEPDYPDQPVQSQSLSRRRMASNIPGLRFQLDLPSGPQFSLTDSGYDFEASTMSVETESLSLTGNQYPYLSSHGHSTEPITPIDQIIHTPDLPPPQVLRCDKGSAYQLQCAEKDDIFSQSVTCVPSLNLYDPYPNSHLLAAAEYSSSNPSPFHASRAQDCSFPSSPLASFHAGVQGAASCLVPLGPEGCQDATRTQDITHLAQLHRRLSYPCDARFLDSRLSFRMTSAAYPCASEENNVASSLGSLELASPAVIRPFYTSDFHCPGSGSSPHTPLDELAVASIHDGPVSQ